LRDGEGMGVASRHGWRLLAVLLLVPGVMFGPGPESACASCVEIPAPGTARKESDVVFSGTVLSREPLYPSQVKSSGDPVKVVFRVSEVWKGVVPEQATVRMTASTAVRFRTGDAYVVYADKSLTGLRIGPCDRAVELSLAGDDLAALGKGRLPPSSPNVAERIRAHPAGTILFWTGTAFAVVAGAFFAILILRMRSRQG